MENGNNLRASFSNKKRMNVELKPGITIVEVCGKERVLIENHRGIIGYCDNEIRIKAQYGRIHVCGNQLKLSKMSKVKLVITGRISGVNLLGRDDCNVI